MYFKEFEIRWSDIDANQHLGNAVYVDYLSHTRMSFFKEKGLGVDIMNKHNLGPVALYEHVYYFREVLIEKTIKVSLETSGYSEDGRFIAFEHNFYDEEGKNLAHSDMLFSWIDMDTRKLATIPEDIIEIIKTFPKSENFKILTSEDTRKYGKRPKDLKL